MECTEWSVQARHVDATGCVTTDGIVLRAEGTWNGTAGTGHGAVGCARTDSGQRVRAAGKFHPRAIRGAMKGLLVLAALAATPAVAAEHPPTMPQRDVDVTYRMVQPVEGGPELHQRTRWLVASGLMRVDTPSPGLYMIMDYRTRHVAMVKVNDRAVLDVASASLVAPGVGRGSFAMKGQRRRGRVQCTDWETVDAAGQAHSAVPDRGRRDAAGQPEGRRAAGGDGRQLRSAGPGVVQGAPDGFRHIDGSQPPTATGPNAALPGARPPGAKP